MDAEEAVKIILTSDEEVVEMLDEGVVKDVVKDVRELGEVDDDELRVLSTSPRSENKKTSSPNIDVNQLVDGTAGDFPNTSYYFDNPESVANWVYSTVQTAFEKSKLSDEAIKAVVEQALKDSS